MKNNSSSPSSALLSSVLFQRIKKLVSTERRIGVEILECLYEIERRKAYAELRYDGLFTYCVKELGFTDSQAYQRIQAMRALKEIPELKPMIEEGSLSVSSVSKVQTHLRQEKKAGRPSSKTEKLQLFQSVENHTSREVDKKLSEIRGERIRPKLVLEMNEELEGLWGEVKGLVAHQSQGMESEVLKILAREWLKRHSPLREVKERQVKQARRTVPLSTWVQSTQNPSVDNTRETSPPKHLGGTSPGPTHRYIPAPLRRELWKAYGGKCARCGSRHALEIDHIIPVALNGKTERKNLRLLCRSCNQFAAVQVFGFAKIERARVQSWRSR